MAALAVRSADFLMALAYATDLATGQSRDFALRSCVLAMRLAEPASLDIRERRNVYHQALLRYIGCNADTHLMAAAFGDEIALRRDIARIDMGNQSEIVEAFVRAFTRLFADAPPAELAKAVQQGLAEALQVSVPILAGHCEVAQRIAERIGLSEEIRNNLGQLYERWDGHGLPRGLKGKDVNVPVRMVTLAQDAIVLTEAHGMAAMAAMIAKRRRRRLRAGARRYLFLASTPNACSPELGVFGPVDRATILALGARTPRRARRGRVRGSLPRDRRHDRHADALHVRAFARGRGARRRGGQADRACPRPTSATSGCAAYTHDIGELAVPVYDLDARRRPDSQRETDAARLHPYHGERALASSGRRRQGRRRALVQRHHERNSDGSGYSPRSSAAPDLSPAARILAAAEAFQTATRSAAPIAPPMSDCRRGRETPRRRPGRESCCPDAVEAVRARRPANPPAGTATDAPARV